MKSKVLITILLIGVGLNLTVWRKSVFLSKRNPADSELSHPLVKDFIKYKAYLYGENYINCDDQRADEQSRSHLLALKNSAKIQDEQYVDPLRRNYCGGELAEKISGQEQSTNSCEEKFGGVFNIYAAEVYEKTKQDAKWFRGLRGGEYKLKGDNNKLNEPFEFASNLKKRFEKEINSFFMGNDEKVFFFHQYIKNVYMPTRSFYLALSPYYNKISLQKLNLLLPDIKSIEVPKEGLDRAKFLLGPDPSTEPFPLKLSNEDKLTHEQSVLLISDAKSLYKIKTPHNYVLALKWFTIQKMLNQAKIAKLIAGDASEFSLPKSCLLKENGGLEKTQRVTFDDSKREEIISNVLKNLGIVADDAGEFQNYFVHEINRNPLKEGFTGMRPLQNYINAYYSLENNKLNPTARLDDFLYFDEVSQKVKEQTSEIFYMRKRLSPRRNGKFDIYRDRTINLFNDLFSTPVPSEEYSFIPGKKGNAADLENLTDAQLKQKTLIDFELQNLSTYLVKKMVALKKDDLMSVIPNSIRSKMQSRIVKIDMPSPFAESTWNVWGYRQLGKALKNIGVKQRSKLSHFLYYACNRAQRNEHINEICDVFKKEGNNFPGIDKAFNRLNVIFAPYIGFDRVTPSRFEISSDAHAFYPLFKILWTHLRDDMKLLPEVITNEFDFLMDQHSSGNPWARVRLSYLIAKDDLQRKSQDYSINCGCEFSNAKSSYELLVQAGKVSGLESVFRPYYGDSLLSVEDKSQIWDQISYYEKNKFSHLLTAGLSDKNTYLTYFDNLSRKTFVVPEQMYKYLYNEYPRGIEFVDTYLPKDITEKIYKDSELFYELYKKRGDKKAINKFFRKNKNTLGRYSQAQIKMLFFHTDQSLKYSLYKDLIKQAAQKRSKEVLIQLGEYCNTSLADHENMKSIFYASTREQDAFNQALGIKEVPKEVRDLMESLSPDEFNDLKLAGYQMLGIMGTAFGGPLCMTLAPIMCAPVMGAVMIGSIYSVGASIYITDREIERKLNGDAHAEFVNRMQAMGFAKNDAELFKRTYFFAALEFANIFPMIGPAIRGVKISSRVGKLSLKKSLGFIDSEIYKASVKRVISDVDLEHALVMLKHSSTDEAVSGTKNLKTKVKSWMAQDETQSIVKHNLTRSEVDEKVVQVATKFLGSSKANLKNLMNTYFGRDMKKIKKASEYLKSLENNTELLPQRAPLIGPVWHGMKKARYKYLDDYKQTFERLVKNFDTHNADLEDFIRKNLDDLTTLFTQAPFIGRESLYMGLGLGSPHVGGFLNGRSMPVLGRLSRGLVMRRFFQSRVALTKSILLTDAHKALGISLKKTSLELAESMDHFARAVDQAALLEDSVKRENILKNLERIRFYIVDQIIEISKKRGVRLPSKDRNEVFRLMFYPQNITEQTMGSSFWSVADSSEILGTKEIGSLAHEVMSKLSHFDNIDEFEHMLSALRMYHLNYEVYPVDFM